MRYYDLYGQAMSADASDRLRQIIGQPMVTCRQCSRSMYHGFAGVLCWDCTNT